MFSFRKRVDPVGRAQLCAGAAERQTMAGGVLQAGRDLSWMRGMRVGDDQGQSGACQLFDLAKRYEILTGAYVADTTVLHVYDATLKRLGRPWGGGLTTREAFAAALGAGWVRAGQQLAPATLDDLAGQPLVSMYDADVFAAPNRAGCVNCNARLRGESYHSVCLVAAGAVAGESGEWVYHAGSWGLAYGHRGITMMPLWRHKQALRELWKIV
jgi:hypothetical protein